MNKSMTGIGFVKKHLPTHLQRYANLIPPIVNEHAGWLAPDDNESGRLAGESVLFDVEAGHEYTVLATDNPDPVSALVQEAALAQQNQFTREFVLTVAMTALGQAWENWQQSRDRFTEPQFISYAKKCVRGAILKELEPAFDARRVWAREQDQVTIAQSEELRRLREQFEAEHEATERQESERLALSQGIACNATGTSDRSRGRRVETLLQFEAEKDDQFFEFEDVFRDLFGYDYDEFGEDEQADGSVEPREQDIDAQVNRELAKSYAMRLSSMDFIDSWEASLVPRMRLLLPEREAELLECKAAKISEAEIARRWGVTRARVAQLEKQATQRLAGYLARLKAGESYTALFQESVRANATALKKQRAAEAKKVSVADGPTP